MKLSHLLTSILTSTLFLTACTGNETGNRGNVNPDAIYFDYKIWGEEKDSSVTVYLQYHRGGPNGTTLLLDEPAEVKLDSERFRVDSSRLGGIFYELQKPSEEFAGKHTIIFTDQNKKEYSEEFIYRPFHLKTKIPAIMERGNLVFDLDGLEVVDYVTVFATDTSFTSKDINRIDTVKNGRLIIYEEELKNLVDGPVSIQFNKDIEGPVKQGTKKGGRIVIRYSLQREFELRTKTP